MLLKKDIKYGYFVIYSLKKRPQEELIVLRVQLTSTAQEKRVNEGNFSSLLSIKPKISQKWNLYARRSLRAYQLQFRIHVKKADVVPKMELRRNA